MIKAYSVWLDFFRGVAALVVFMGHARLLFLASPLAPVGLGAATNGATQTADMMPTTDPGHIAVIVFFVLSGYLVGGGVIRALRTQTWSFRSYALSRLSRLWTVLIPVLILGFLLDSFGLWFFGDGSIYGGLFDQLLVLPDLGDRLTFGTLLVNVFFLQNIHFGTYLGTNGPLWTLAYEFWFYAAFPMLALALWPGTALAVRLAAAAGLFTVSLFVGPVISLYFIIWLLGASLELVPRKIPQKVARWATIAMALCFGVICLLVLRAKLHIYISDGVEAVAFTILCYFLLHLRMEWRSNLFTRFSHALSSISFTLYLVHAPVLVFICAVLMPTWNVWPLTTLGIAGFAAVCAATLGIAIGIYWLFERNTHHVRKWMLGRSFRLFPAPEVPERQNP